MGVSESDGICVEGVVFITEEEREEEEEEVAVAVGRQLSRVFAKHSTAVDAPFSSMLVIVTAEENFRFAVKSLSAEFRDRVERFLSSELPKGFSSEFERAKSGLSEAFLFGLLEAEKSTESKL